jgi:hypothetical protein
MTLAEIGVIAAVGWAVFGGKKKKKANGGGGGGGGGGAGGGVVEIKPGVPSAPTDMLDFAKVTDDFGDLDLATADKVELLRGVAFTVASLGRAYGEILARGDALQAGRAATNLPQLVAAVALTDTDPGDGSVLAPLFRDRIGPLTSGMGRMLSAEARADAQASVLLGASDPDWDVPLGLVIDTVVAAWRDQGADELVERVLAVLLGFGG